MAVPPDACTFCDGIGAADALGEEDEDDEDEEAGADDEDDEDDAEADEVEAMMILAGCTADAGESDCPGSADGA